MSTPAPRRRGRHAARRTTRAMMWGALVSLLALTGASLYQAFVEDIGLEALTWWNDEVQQGFPGAIDVYFGPPAQFGATALFPGEGIPNSEVEPKTFEWDWIKQKGGLYSPSALVYLGFTSDRSERVIIHDITVRVLKCGIAPSGTFMNVAPKGGGDTFDRLLIHNLDSPNNADIYYSNETETGTWQFPVSFSRDDAESLTIEAVTWDGDYEFAIDIEYEYNGTTRIESISKDTNNRPFRIAGPGHAVEQVLIGVDNERTVVAGAPIDQRQTLWPGRGWNDSSPRAC